ncbi:MAG: prephenate dehydratase [Gammaproteobacteria bacterium]|nr:prephenate dehydratase [bacterium AH-315-E07]PCH60584.1 MAG: prephenate dehydratase [Gammaproteobacteria bacterium]
MVDLTDLDQVRGKIDALDRQLLDLISERARLAQDVARIKQSGNEEVFYRPEREAEVLRQVIEANPGPLSNESIRFLFREVMSACLALEQPLKIAYLGPQGTFTQLASHKQFGHAAETIAFASISDIFRSVSASEVDFGVVPIENSTEGMVSQTLDMFVSSPLKICGEVELRIHHHLMSKAAKLADIDVIYAHQQSFAQCRQWMDGHLSGLEQVSVSSNAEAARLAAESESAAAIGSETASEIYGLGVLASKIEDAPDNTTRFLVLGRQLVKPSGKDKTSLLLSTTNRSGSLFELLQPFAKHKVSMTRIESRPSRQANWNYLFFVDVEGHIEDESVAQAVAEVNTKATTTKILGSYPSALS